MFYSPVEFLFQSFRFTEEDCEILESLFHRDDSGGYAVRVPGGQWFGAWKFKMVTEFAEAGAKLYHKLRDGLEEELAAHKARARRNVYQEITVTLTPSDVDEETYTVGSIGKSRLRDVSTDHHMDWGRLAKEGASQIRTRTPPPLLYIKGHAKFEGQKLANVPCTSGFPHSTSLGFSSTYSRSCTLLASYIGWHGG